MAKFSVVSENEITKNLYFEVRTLDYIKFKGSRLEWVKPPFASLAIPVFLFWQGKCVCVCNLTLITVSQLRDRVTWS